MAIRKHKTKRVVKGGRASSSTTVNVNVGGRGGGSRGGVRGGSVGSMGPYGRQASGPPGVRAFTGGTTGFSFQTPIPPGLQSWADIQKAIQYNNPHNSIPSAPGNPSSIPGGYGGYLPNENANGLTMSSLQNIPRPESFYESALGVVRPGIKVPEELGVGRLIEAQTGPIAPLQEAKHEMEEKHSSVSEMGTGTDLTTSETGTQAGPPTTNEMGTGTDLTMGDIDHLQHSGGVSREEARLRAMNRADIVKEFQEKNIPMGSGYQSKERLIENYLNSLKN